MRVCIQGLLVLLLLLLLPLLLPFVCVLFSFSSVSLLLLLLLLFSRLLCVAYAPLSLHVYVCSWKKKLQGAFIVTYLFTSHTFVAGAQARYVCASVFVANTDGNLLCTTRCSCVRACVCCAAVLCVRTFKYTIKKNLGWYASMWRRHWNEPRGSGSPIQFVNISLTHALRLFTALRSLSPSGI